MLLSACIPAGVTGGVRIACRSRNQKHSNRSAGGLFLGGRSLFGGLRGLGCNGDSGVGDETGGLAQLEIALQAVGVQGLLDVVQLHLVALGELLVLFLALFLADLDVLSGSNGVQQDVRADSGLSGGAQAVSDGVHVAAHHLGIGLQGSALGAELIVHALHLLIELLVDHAVGDLDGHVGGSLLDGGVLERAVDPGLLLIADALLDVGAQLGDGVELGDILDKLVVLLGNDGLP